MINTIEYKVITTTVKKAEEELNLLARDGWQVIATNLISDVSFTTGSTPMIITLGRKV